MALEQYKVWEVVRQAVSGSLNIPEFQREFVWDPEQVKRLAESLYRDYPIGSFLLWDSSGYQEPKKAQDTQSSLWIVDGQQRTTALCLLLGRKPYWWDDTRSWNRALERYDVMVNLLPQEGDDRLEFALPNPVRRNDPRWISIRWVLGRESVEEVTSLACDVAGRIGGNPVQEVALFSKIHARLQHLWQIRERDIPVIKINHEVEDVAEIFARLNQEGTRIREADVVLALAAVRNPGWVREEYMPFCKELEDAGWDLDAGVFIRTMTGIGKGRARLIEVPREFWGPENLSAVWRETRKTIMEVLRRLAEFGITSANLLPSRNSLIPLFVLHHRWGTQQGYRFAKAFRWFLMANWDGRYSGSAITSLNEDVRAITGAESFDAAIVDLKKRLRVPSEIPEEEFLNRYDRAGSRFLRLILYLILFRRGARDWVDGTRIGCDRTGALIAAGFEPQWHHVYPRSMLSREGVHDDEVNALANVTILNEHTNVNKLAGKEPSEYIWKYRIPGDALRSHCIPEDFARAAGDRVSLKEQWDVKHYPDFLIERARLLAQEANAFLRELEE